MNRVVEIVGNCTGTGNKLRTKKQADNGDEDSLLSGDD